MSITLDRLSIYSDRQALSDLYVTEQAKLPEKAAAAWNAARALPSPVDSLVRGMEAAYAALVSPDMAVDTRAVIAPVLARVAQIVAENHWHGKSERAFEIVKACRRAAGEDVAGEDPAVDSTFAD